MNEKKNEKLKKTIVDLANGKESDRQRERKVNAKKKAREKLGL